MSADEQQASPGFMARAAVDGWVSEHEDDLIALRRHLHAHPELGRGEHATTDLVAQRLTQAGLVPQRLPGTGLWCDIGTGERVVALRADLDALPLQDAKNVPYRSTTAGVCHACGHDAHTAIAVGVALLLAELDAAGRLPGRVRMIFQPAEEIMPGGALDAVAAGVLEGVSTILAVHCDPALDAGLVGLRVGPITAAADRVEVRLTGPGGHTSRPQNTVDLVYALGRVLTELPAALTRVVDPRAAMTLVWGMVSAGTVPNAIPDIGFARGTLRVLDHDAWEQAPKVIDRFTASIAGVYGAGVTVDYTRGVPPVVNSAYGIELFRQATEVALGPGREVPTPQSLGGEDFGWYLEHASGAMARLGTRVPGGATHDLHQSSFDIDERALAVGVRLLATAALLGLAD